MKITVNGDFRDVPPNLSLNCLIDSLSLKAEATAVQRNEEIVPRSAYAETTLEEGDVIELVRFVGGG